MRVWQQSMIFLARNELVKNFMQNRVVMTDLSKKFVGGKDITDAVTVADRLKEEGFAASLFTLGEYEDDESIIDDTVKTLTSTIFRLADSGLDIHISVDPTQIGYQINPDICNDNTFKLAAKIKDCSQNAVLSNKNVLMVDMEDSSVTQATVDLYMALQADKLPAAITLQAYLYRTEQDLVRVVQNGGSVRLVKGAFAEGQQVAFSGKEKIDARFIQLADIMLSQDAKDSGFYPIFGTHDDAMIEQIINIAQSRNWRQGDYEFEMLYGVRREYQKALLQSGETVRLYLPFGSDWWPYAVRRVGENVKNAKFLLNALLKQ